MAFKIKHIETGLFLGKSTTKIETNPKYRRYKTNLKLRGSIYEFKPTIQQLQCWYSTYYNLSGETVKFNINDFEVVQV